MTNYILWIALHLLLVQQVHFCNADFIEEVYNLIFLLSSDPISDEHVRDGLRILVSNRTGLPLQDPRRHEVTFWLEASENSDSKCNRNEDELLVDLLQQAKTKAGEARREGSSFGSVFNLETYVRSVRSTRLQYCLTQLGATFIQELQENTKDDTSELFDLTDGCRHMENKDTDILGRRIADMILLNSDQASIALLSQSLDDIDLIMENYSLYSPCLTVFQVVDKYAGFYELLAVPENYATLTGDMRMWIDRISVCLFIEESEQVYESAAKHLFPQDLINAGTIDAEDLNDRRYNMIFHYSNEKMTLSSIKLALIELISYRNGLPADDQRRSEVSFWLQAAGNDVSNCNSQQDRILRSHLGEARRKAIEARQEAGVTRIDDALNLESYVDDIMQDRLLYCEYIFGIPFVSELTGQLDTEDKRNFIGDLARDFRHTTVIDTHELGQSIGDLILRNSRVSNLNLPSEPLDSKQVEGLYRKYSPCTSLLEIADNFKNYYSMISVDENYQRLSSSQRDWVDRLSVCNIIDRSEQVFRIAAEYLKWNGHVSEC